MSVDNTIKLYCMSHYYQLYIVGVVRKFAAANDGNCLRTLRESVCNIPTLIFLARKSQFLEHI